MTKEEKEEERITLIKPLRSIRTQKIFREIRTKGQRVLHTRKNK